MKKNIQVDVQSVMNITHIQNNMQRTSGLGKIGLVNPVISDGEKTLSFLIGKN
jgi:hypothetical protein